MPDVIESLEDAHEEDWRPVAGWEGFYSVSSFGRVRSEARVTSCKGRPYRVRARILRPGVHERGYLVVILCRAGVPSRAYVHRLVLEAFVGACPPGMECRHLDGKTGNARRANLAWGTPTENAADRDRHGTQPRGESASYAKLDADQVRRIRADARIQREIAADFGISQTAVSRIKLGRIWGTA